jgi:hypothetical protein
MPNPMGDVMPLGEGTGFTVGHLTLIMAFRGDEGSYKWVKSRPSGGTPDPNVVADALDAVSHRLRETQSYEA